MSKNRWKANRIAVYNLGYHDGLLWVAVVACYSEVRIAHLRQQANELLEFDIRSMMGGGGIDKGRLFSSLPFKLVTRRNCCHDFPLLKVRGFSRG